MVSSVAAPFLSQLQLRQAQSEADRAEQGARVLRARAQAAEREAVRAQEGARALRVQSDQAQQRAGLAKQDVSVLRSLQGASEDLGELRQQISSLGEGEQVSTVPVQPVVNSEGQTTGTVVNTTA
ncbi:MAG: hypothetical protein BWY57_00863 [Betaproteobacteria bacterium ADurb.Bin341]|nr:MAG: hypothetical protein BWY57_00863 [Betaproteobacteria bacterium ADurb.Bin341]